MRGGGGWVRTDCPFLRRMLPFSRVGQTGTHKRSSRLRGWCDLVRMSNFIPLVPGKIDGSYLPGEKNGGRPCEFRTLSEDFLVRTAEETHSQ